MSTQHARRVSRRRFLRGVTLAGTAGLLGWHPRRVAAEPPPETTTLKLAKTSSICGVPLYVAEELFKTEGFSEVQFVRKNTIAETYEALAAGELHFNFQAIGGTILLQLDAGVPVVVLAGVHVGCYELFATEQVRTVRDWRGRTVSLGELRSGRHAFLVTVLTHVGLDPHRDVNVVVNSTLDRPWSYYFCCMLVASREFVRGHPIATKRAMRAILKANTICALEPE